MYAATYLAVGPIYLLANPLLSTDLAPEDIKPGLLGHWGTTPAIHFIYAHVSPVIRQQEVNAVSLAGPGQDGPVRHVWPALEAQP